MKQDAPHILIIEDNLLLSTELEMIIEDMGGTVAGVATSAQKGIELVQSEKPDLIILDLFLDDGSTGFDVLASISPLDVPTIVITAGHDRDLFEKAEQYGPVSFIVKPFYRLTLEATIELALNRAAEQRTANPVGEEDERGEILFKEDIFIRDRHVLRRIPLSDIEAIEADGNYCLFITRDRKFATKISMKGILEKLPEHSFVQIHRTFAVNTSKIKSIDMNENTMTVADRDYPIGRTYRSSILDQIWLI
jgi:two-component system, response regulator PdtaR